MTSEQQTAINQLRSAGYCVIIWTPAELGEIPIRYLEDIIIERGNDFIESCNSPE